MQLDVYYASGRKPMRNIEFEPLYRGREWSWATKREWSLSPFPVSRGMECYEGRQRLCYKTYFNRPIFLFCSEFLQETNRWIKTFLRRNSKNLSASKATTALYKSFDVMPYQNFTSLDDTMRLRMTHKTSRIAFYILHGFLIFSTILKASADCWYSWWSEERNAYLA